MELARVTKSGTQDELKRTLKDASEYGMLNTEKPVAAAPDVFVDPPTIIYAPPAQMWPDAAGKVTLRCNIRSADTLAWYKNGIPLKEGADGGRITGVATNQVVFAKLLGRDTGAKIYARGKNKWGQVETTPCELMLPGTGGPAEKMAPIGGDAAVDAKEDAASSEKRTDMLIEVTSVALSWRTGKKGLVSRMTGFRKSSKDSKDESRSVTESISEDGKPRTASSAREACAGSVSPLVDLHTKFAQVHLQEYSATL